jgi:RimJ/RimL family protein N-acetyltransferase
MDSWQSDRESNRVRLRGVEPSDAEFFFAWNRDSDMNRYLDQVWFPASLEFVRQWAERTAAQGPKDDSFQWVIENAQGQAVGSITAHHCDRRAGTFEYGVAIKSEHQRQGYAAEAIKLVLRYFFDELRYQKVTVQIHSDNPASIQLHEKLGFQLEGRLRRVVYNHGEYFDGLMYGLTVEEFRAMRWDSAS